jgi:hypothetical protein
MATTDREKEREAELEGAMYTNCLLLGLDPAVLGSPTGSRVGLFRHSNPRLGEQLLYFLLSSLRGPAQSAKAQSDPFLLFFAYCCFLSSPTRVLGDLGFPWPLISHDSPQCRTSTRSGRFLTQPSPESSEKWDAPVHLNSFFFRFQL